MRSIYGISLSNLEDYFINKGEKKYIASQIYDWLYVKKVNNLDKMTNIKKETKCLLEKDFSFKNLVLVKKEEDELVEKFLFELNDGEQIETVLMYHDYGLSICISSQVGCNMGCKFCESGRLKKIRNLKAEEMVLQILQAEKITQKRISHVVVMGIGEPFDNYDNLINFIKIINENKGLNIGIRHITVSTCGLVKEIKKLANEDLQVNLAISLHAPTDEIRNQIMPINKVYNIKTLIDALKEYLKKTNRRITFEYILLSGINDFDECAIKLAKLVNGMNCYINLIPYNETLNNNFKRTNNCQIMRFYDILKKNKINVTIRKEFGSKVSAACGQLRANNSKDE